jgi:hypothetical protein
MWFLGYGLDNVIPNHSILSKARKRWGQNVFVALFSRVVAQCVSAGLVDGTKIYVDSSLLTNLQRRVRADLHTPTDIVASATQ